MTQVIDEDGVITPVTVLKADENVVVQVKTKDVDGYNAIQVGTRRASRYSCYFKG